MSAPPNRIDFVVAGGARVGMGHVMRSGTLAAAARQRGWSVRVFLEGEAIARERWVAVSGARRVLDWADWNPHDAAPLSLLDHPAHKDPWLDRLQPAPTRAVVLDDLRSIRRAALTICPALQHAGLSAGSEPGRSRLLAGPRFSILGQAHRASPRRPLATRARLLLSIGGSDPHHVTPRIAPVLDHVLESMRSVGRSSPAAYARDVVLGPAFQDPGDGVARALAAAGWHVHHALAPAQMARLMSAARLAVMGFGTSLAELAWHGTPQLSVTHHPSDDPWARRLEARGIGVHLGQARTLDLDAVATRLRHALADERWQRESAARAYDALEDGRGCERILDRLAALFPSRSTCAQTIGAARTPPSAVS